MAQVSAVARLVAAEGKAEELEAALADLVAAVQETEPGTLVYAAGRDAADQDVFWFYELYESQAAADAHSGGTALAEAGARMKGLLAGRPEVHRLRPVAAKGLPG